jgi:hypothetical protein
MSANSVMVARIMLDNGYKLESGLGRNLQGRLDPIEVKDKKDTYGLGYTPTREDRRKFFAQKRRRMLNSQGWKEESLTVQVSRASYFRVIYKDNRCCWSLATCHQAEASTKPRKEEQSDQKEKAPEPGESSNSGQAIDEIPPWVYQTSEEEVATVHAPHAVQTYNTIRPAAPGEGISNKECL